MEVNQKRITVIRLHDGKGCEIRLSKEGEGYQLQLASDSNVVNISLAFQDVRKLCLQLVRLDLEENWKAHYAPPPEFGSFFCNGSPSTYQEHVTSWFKKMAGEAF